MGSSPQKGLRYIDDVTTSKPERLDEALASFDEVWCPRGTEHRPSSPGGSILMFEPSGTLSTGDSHEALPDHVDSTAGHKL